ncbi:hypothetical protein T4B_5967, partial [Trichinella pseudospiralis]
LRGVMNCSMNFLEKRMSQLEALIIGQSEVFENFEESIWSQYKDTKLALNEFLQNKLQVKEYLQECKDACDIIQPRVFIEILLSPNAKLQLIMLKMDSLKALIAMFAKVSSFSPVLNSESIRVVNSYPPELTRTSENFLTTIEEKEWSISIPLGFLKRKDRYSENPSIEIFVISNESNELSGHLSSIA